jgi:hypothetical protein
MIDTSRIQSGFDAELMLGGKWFLTAVQTLAANGLISLPDGATISNVSVIPDEEWDLAIEISGIFIVKASMEIVDNKFSFVTDFNNSSFTIDMPNFGQLAHPPVLKKTEGDSEHENAMALLINLALLANPQNEDPIPDMERGDPDNAISFLPKGQHIALGIASESFKRFANNIWHSNLRAEDGTHPLPDKENKKGDWKKVKASLNKDRIKFTIEGEVPIDLWPDADVTLEIEITPILTDGKLTFSINTDLDIDTGLWGDILAYTIGAVIGLVIGLFTGGFGLIPAIGFGTMVLLEIGEYVAGEVIERKLVVKDETGKPITYLIPDGGIVKFASPRPPEDSLSIGFLDAIPSSIPIFSDQTDILYNHLYTIHALFDDMSLNSNGLATAGKSEPSGLFEPVPATIIKSTYEQDDLKSLTYRVLSDNEEVILAFEEVLGRAGEGELIPPLKINSSLEDPIIQIPSGKLCCPYLTPTNIRRKDSVITRIKFSDGLELNTTDAVELQDSAGVLLKGLQLIHPKDGDPYFRSPANETKADNFESLPRF